MKFVMSGSPTATLPSVGESPRQREDRTMFGFLAPNVFNEEITNFFSRANIGPRVEGQFVTKTDTNGLQKLVPDARNLHPTQERLNDSLYFTKRDVNHIQNPLNRITTTGSLPPLFALHAYYAGLQVPHDHNHLSASQEMRRDLKETMTQVILRDANNVLDEYNGNMYIVDQVNKVAGRMINNIDHPENTDPNAGNIYDDEGSSEVSHRIFNPNHFIYAEFSKIILVAKVGPLPEAQIAALNPRIREVYSTFEPFKSLFALATEGGTPVNYLLLVNTRQHNIVSLARTYKNQIQAAAIRERRITQNAIQQMQMPVASLSQTNTISQQDQALLSQLNQGGINLPSVGMPVNFPQ